MAAAASRSIVSASSCCAFSSRKGLLCAQRKARVVVFSSSASSSTSNPEEDCNDEECAPEKEVGKVSVEWLAGDKTKVVGTYPPRKRGWTGYVEKDTAGQTNIYSVEPAVYIAESAISSGTAGSSSEGSENTAAIAAGLALVCVAAASSVLLRVNKNTPQTQTTEYSGPPLSYYINKFQPVSVVEAAVPTDLQNAPPVQTESELAESSQVQIESIDKVSENSPSESSQAQVELSNNVEAIESSAE